MTKMTKITDHEHDDTLFDALAGLDRIEGLAALLLASLGDADTGVTDRQIQGVSDCLMAEIQRVRTVVESVQS